MKRDLLIAAALVVLAGLGIGLVAVLPGLQRDDGRTPFIKPRTEPSAALPKPEEPKKTHVKKEPVRLATNDKDTPKTETKTPVEPEPKQNTPEPKKDPEPNKTVEPPLVKKIDEPKKVDEPKKKVDEPRKKLDEPKIAVKKDGPMPAKFIAVDEHLAKLNDPDGEYTVKSMHRGMQIKLIGKIKTLKIADVNERSTLDVSELIAEEVVFIGNVNSGSTVILGKADMLKIRDVNEKSTIDATAVEARGILVEGAINSGSTLKLKAPKGTVEFTGEINDRSQIEVAAPEGKVVFKGRGDSAINSNARVTVQARHVEFGGAINGPETQINITLTKDGSLKFRRLSGGVQMLWNKADARDPEPRIDAGAVDARAIFRGTGKK
jgi:hypothetical protein